MTMMATEKEAAPDNTTLQMVRAEINGREFQRWMGSRRLQDPDHAAHCLLKECFGELAPKPFRLIMPRDGTTGLLYGYGLAGAEALREAVVPRIAAMSDEYLSTFQRFRPWGEISRMEAMGHGLIGHANGHLGRATYARALLGKPGLPY